jgi:dTDP-4-amino-4,6-dideoxygalactose transaminase
MRQRYQYDALGHNLRLTEMQAALGVAQLARLGEITEARRQNAQRLTLGLDGIDGLELPRQSAGASHVFHQYTVRVTDDRLDRDTLAKELAQSGVGSAVHYPRVAFDYDCYRGHPRVRSADVPHARRAASQVLSLPVHQRLAERDVDAVVGAVRRVFEARGVPSP